MTKKKPTIFLIKNNMVIIFMAYFIEGNIHFCSNAPSHSKKTKVNVSL